MICGVSRLSSRSFVATGVFCGVCFVLVKFMSRTESIYALFYPKVQAEPFMTFPSLSHAMLLFLVMVICVGVTAALVLIGFSRQTQKHTYNELRSHLLGVWSGVVFAIGLGLSGMTLPQKVLGFFDIGGPHFDPSLMCVALGAILPDLIIFQQYILPFAKNNIPLFAEKFNLPTKTEITPALVIGAALFGVGWGLLGACPGPMIVNIASFRPEVLIWLVCFAVGSIGTHKLIHEQKLKL
jgi:uncharacterized membrane protein YedE/YeeE